MIKFHDSLGPTVHPWCTDWYNWAPMLQPMEYHHVEWHKDGIHWVSDMHSLGNLAIYWGIIGAVLFALGYWVLAFWQWFSQGTQAPHLLSTGAILMGYGANYAPWATVDRCLFFYQYPSANKTAPIIPQ